jgi:hypothetical protein
VQIVKLTDAQALVFWQQYDYWLNEQDRIEVEAVSLVVLARQVRTFTTYFCGLKKEKPVWCYQEFLAARLNFAEAEKMATTLGADVFALPATERRAAARQRSW